MKSKLRFLWLLLPIAAVLFWPRLHTLAQGSAGFTKIASVTATSYTDTSCPKGATCSYQVTATANGLESGPSNTISVANTGTLGTIGLSWSAGTCAAGTNCATPTGYNVYQEAPPVPPVGLVGARN